jgi:hypothetical protein
MDKYSQLMTEALCKCTTGGLNVHDIPDVWPSRHPICKQLFIAIYQLNIPLDPPLQL